MFASTAQDGPHWHFPGRRLIAQTNLGLPSKKIRCEERSLLFWTENSIAKGQCPPS